MTAPKTLLDRLAAADGPDRGLDAEIAVAAGVWTEHHYDAWHRYEECGEAVNPPLLVPVPPSPYTASLDAAMSLVPDGWLLITLSDIKADGFPWCVLGRPEDAATAEGIADHDKILALCIAALKARGIE